MLFLVGIHQKIRLWSHNITATARNTETATTLLLLLISKYISLYKKNYSPSALLVSFLRFFSSSIFRYFFIVLLTVKSIEKHQICFNSFQKFRLVQATTLLALFNIFDIFKTFRLVLSKAISEFYNVDGVFVRCNAGFFPCQPIVALG